MASSPGKSGWIAYALMAAGGAAYAYLTLAAPPDTSSERLLHLNHQQLILLQLTIIGPYLVAWAAGTAGALGFRRCGSLLPSDGGGHGFRDIGTGVLILVWGSMVSSISGAARTYAQVAGGAIGAFVIVNNYVYVLTAFLAFLYFFNGTRRLVKAADSRVHDRDDRIIMGTILAIITALYLALVFTNHERQISGAAAGATYYLPDALIVLTVVLPLAAAWGLGFLSALQLTRYMPSGRDPSQRRLARMIVNGLWTTLFASIFLQVLVSVGSTRLFALGLGPILALVYVLIGFQIAGFILIALGSRRLCRTAETAASPAPAPDL